jgi:hypothetical protein
VRRRTQSGYDSIFSFDGLYCAVQGNSACQASKTAILKNLRRRRAEGKKKQLPGGLAESGQLL